MFGTCRPDECARRCSLTASLATNSLQAAPPQQAACTVHPCTLRQCNVQSGRESPAAACDACMRALHSVATLFGVFLFVSAFR